MRLVRDNRSIRFDRETRRTKSEFKDDTDINQIVAKYRRTGILPVSAHASAARYGDFSQIPDYAEMLLRVHAAEDLFNALPSIIRKKFDNNPQEFIKAVQSGSENELVERLGLVRELSEKGNKQASEEAGAKEVKVTKTKTPPSQQVKTPESSD